MNPRVNYEMTEEDLKELCDACKPVLAMMIGGYAPSSPQENANRAWARLGKKMGFDSETVRPIEGKGSRFFSAVPSETEAQKEERLVLEKKEKDERRMRELEVKIFQYTQELETLKTTLENHNV